MKTTSVQTILLNPKIGNHVNVKGWVRTFRNNQFISLNDGSTIHGIQAVVDFENTDESLLKRVHTGTALSITGELVNSKGQGQAVEIKVEDLAILGDCDANKYPLQPKNIR